MSVKKAIQILEEFIQFKQICVENMDKDRFKTDVEEIRKMLVNLHAGDKRVLEVILSQIKSTEKDSKKNEKSNILSLEMKKVIADEVKKSIFEYKKSQRKPKVTVKNIKQKLNRDGLIE